MEVDVRHGYAAATLEPLELKLYSQYAGLAILFVERNNLVVVAFTELFA